MSDEEKQFMEDCRKSKKYGSIEEYNGDIVRFLMLSGWHFTEEDAKALVSDEGPYIEKAFEKETPVSNIALDIGYSCG